MYTRTRARKHIEARTHNVHLFVSSVCMNIHKYLFKIVCMHQEKDMKAHTLTSCYIKQLFCFPSFLFFKSCHSLFSQYYFKSFSPTLSLANFTSTSLPIFPTNPSVHLCFARSFPPLVPLFLTVFLPSFPSVLPSLPQASLIYSLTLFYLPQLHPSVSPLLSLFLIRPLTLWQRTE